MAVILPLDRRRCTKCSETKPLSAFHFRKKVGGYRSECRACANKARRSRPQTIAHRFHVSKHNARVKRLIWTITRAEHAKVVADPCYYCGGALNPTGSGLDRLDPNLGYILENVVACCAVCNMAKGRFFTPEEMKKLGAVIAEIKRARYGN